MATPTPITTIARGFDKVGEEMAALMATIPVTTVNFVSCSVVPFGQDNYLITIVYSV
jgi:hypothetical protein